MKDEPIFVFRANSSFVLNTIKFLPGIYYTKNQKIASSINHFAEIIQVHKPQSKEEFIPPEISMNIDAVFEDKTVKDVIKLIKEVKPKMRIDESVPRAEFEMDNSNDNNVSSTASIEYSADNVDTTKVETSEIDEEAIEEIEPITEEELSEDEEEQDSEDELDSEAIEEVLSEDEEEETVEENEIIESESSEENVTIEDIQKELEDD